MFKRKRSYRKPCSNRTYIGRIGDAAPNNQMSRYMSDFNPFPAVHYATLRYVTKVSLTVAAANVAPTHYFRANSIHDPDYTGSVFGGQPYGHDTYQSIYNHYQVLGSTITVQCNPANNQRYFGVGCLLQDNNNIIEDEARQLCAMKGSSYMRSGNGGILTVKRSFNTKYMQDGSTQTASMGSDPIDPFYFVVFSTEDDIPNISISCLVTISYRCKFWEIKDLSAL